MFQFDMKYIFLYFALATASFSQTVLGPGYGILTNQLSSSGTSPGSAGTVYLAPPTSLNGFILVDGNSATKQTVMGTIPSGKVTVTRTGTTAARTADLTFTWLASDISDFTSAMDTYMGGSASGLVTTVTGKMNNPTGTNTEFVAGDGSIQPLPTLVSMGINSWATTALAPYALDSALTAGLLNKFDTPTGTTLQYIRGNGSLATFPTDLSSFSNGPAYITASALSPYATTSSVTAALGGYATSSALTSGLSGKFDNPTGTTLQYLRGDGSVATFPTNNTSFTNGAGYLTGITSGQVTTALGFTPVSQTGARTAVSVTTTGSGNATYDSATGVFNVPNTTYTLPSVGSAGTYSGVTTDAQGRVTAGTARSFNNTPARSLVVTAAAANGFQIDASRDALAFYSVTISTSSTLTSGAAGYVVLEVAATNSATASDWKEIARTPDGQQNGLIVGLTLNQLGGGVIMGMVQAGWYARLRYVNTVGTPTYTYNSGQEVKM